MSSDELEQISQELDRISSLSLDEQIGEFALIRETLEAELNSSSSNSVNQNSAQVR